MFRFNFSHANSDNYSKMIEIPEFPCVWDSTMRSQLVSCERQSYWGTFRGLRKPGGSINLHFGGCLARGLEISRKAFYKHNRPLDNAIQDGISVAVEMWGDGDELVPQRGPSANKTIDALVDALASYFERFPMDTDDLQPYRFQDEPAIEVSFALPIPGTAHPVTGQPLIYSGRFDMIGFWRDANAIFVDDEKHSTQLGDSWRMNWKLRGQLSGYIWGCRSYGIAVQGAIVRGIGILKGDITFAEVIETRPAWQVDQWLAQLVKDLNRAMQCWLDMRGDPERYLSAWSQSLDSACSSYGGCQFIDLCDSEHPERWVDNYNIEHWNPLKRGIE